MAVAFELQFVERVICPQAKEFIDAYRDDARCSASIHLDSREYPEGMRQQFKVRKSELGRFRSVAECHADPDAELIAFELSLCRYEHASGRLDDSENGYSLDFGEHWSHANVALIDKRARAVERFEPWGSENGDALLPGIDGLFREALCRMVPDLLEYRWIAPRDYCPVGPQTLQANAPLAVELRSKAYVGGFCGWWSLLYLKERLAGKDPYRIVADWSKREPDELFSLIWHFRETLLSDCVPD